MQKYNIRKFLDKLKKKFQVSIFNESTLETFFSFRVSRLDGLFLVASAFIVFFVFSFILILYTPLNGFLPKYLDPDLKKQLLADAYKVDSLTEVIDKQTQYISVVKGIIAGEVPVDSADYNREIPIDTLANRHLELMKPTDKEEEFRQEYEQKEKYNLSTLSPQDAKSVILFYPPIKGKIVSAFNSKQKKYGIDINVDDRQAVLSVLDGTVIYAGYIPNYQYVIQVQHTNDFVSIYKFNAELLKKQGDVVRAGEAIAMIGKTSTGKEQPHLFFELWQKGLPLNPEEYIVF